MKLLEYALLGAGLVIALGSTSPVSAATIVVENASFETRSLASGAFSVTVPEGWRSMNADSNLGVQIGLWRPTTEFSFIPDGNNIAYVFGGDTLYQTLTAELAANTRYRLQVDHGYRATLAAGDVGYVVELRAGDRVLASTSSNTVAAAAGGWATSELVFDSIGPVNPGERLGIYLRNSAHSAYFDNVRFESESLVSAVPEPATWALMIAGFGGVGAALRRRRIQIAFA